MSLDLITYPDREAQAEALAQRIADDLRMALAASPEVTLCVPGGSTPAPVFRALSRVVLDWDRVVVLANDERWVDASHPRSNGAMIRRELICNHAAAARYFDLYTGAATPQEAAPDLTQRLGPKLPLSVLLLGMGEDMHTASLFPEASGLEALLAPDAPAVMAAAGGAEPRITLSAPALQAAISKHLMITGEAKRDALARARDLPPHQAPIAAILDGLQVHWAP